MPEIEKYVTATGELVAWVKLASISSSDDTEFYMYYGNTEATNSQNPPGVWSNGFVAVWHLRENVAGTGTANVYQNSVSDNYHGLDMVSSTDKTGKVGDGQRIPTNEYVNFGSIAPILNQQQLTITAWVRRANANANIKVGKQVEGHGMLLEWAYWEGTNYNSYFLANGSESYGYNTHDGTDWDYLAMTFNGALSGNTNRLHGYLNAEVQVLEFDGSTIPATTTSNDTADFILNHIPVYSAWGDGYYDEVRVANVARSDAWITAEYLNQNNPSTFYVLEEVETEPEPTPEPTPTPTPEPTPTPSPTPSPTPVACYFLSVSEPLTDLGSDEYHRLTSLDPPTYTPTGFTGGLYPDGQNTRPTEHEAAGVALAQEIVPRDAEGNPSESGKIGFTSIGMSNTNSEFGTFMSAVNAYSPANDNLVLVNGAAGGGVIERWADPENSFFETYWGQLDDKVASAGLTDEQVQVVWVKITQTQYKANFPEDMETFQGMMEDLAVLLKEKYPNLKITYFSSRTRSHLYMMGLSPETTAFENGLAVKWMIEKQIDGHPDLNYDSDLGPTPVSYLSWGPYLWIDGENERLDGRTWPLNHVSSDDCTHPTAEGTQAVSEMMMEFFTTDTTTTPWFLDEPEPTPTPTPSPTPEPESWLSNDWEYRNLVTINPENIDETLTDFPVLVSITSTDLKDNAQADADDIVFTAVDGITLLDHEIEKYVTDTGELVAWVKLPSISSSVDTEFYMYYGNPEATDSQNPSDVWSNDFLAVWHLGEDVAGIGTTNAYRNSVSNTYHGMDMVSNSDKTGVIGDGQRMTEEEYVSFGDIQEIKNISQVTITAWIRRASENALVFVGKQNDSGHDLITEFYLDGNLYYGVSNGDFANGDVESNDTDWHYTSLVFNGELSGDANRLKGYLDGNPQTLNDLDTVPAVTTNEEIDWELNRILAWVPWDEGYGDGYYDEVRIATTARSDAWIKAEHFNQNSPLTFYTVSDTETGGEEPEPTPSPTPTPAPVLTNIVPNSEYNDQAIVPFELTGTDFLDGASVSLILEDNPTISATDVTVESATTITGLLDLDGVVVGVYDVVVTNTDEQFDTLEAGFAVLEAEPEPTPSPEPTLTPSPTPEPEFPENMGPLTVDEDNSRYFSNAAGTPVLMVGSHTWGNLQKAGFEEPPEHMDYEEYLDFLENYNHNFIRLWTWENARWMSGFDDFYIEPLPYARTGPGTALDGKPKFDLTAYDQEYFDTLRQRVIQAGERGMYVSVMLFQGWSVDDKGYTNSNPWEGHPYHQDNNINSINGDPSSDGSGIETHTLAIPTITALQEAYIEKVVDTVNEFPNVLYEVSNESHGDSEAWQYHVINYLNDYQADKPNQHPVGMTVEYPGGNNSDIFNSPADWVSPSGDINNPPANDGSKVVIVDTDHLCGICGSRDFVWKSFARGNNPIFMDAYDGATWGLPPGYTFTDPTYVSLRENLGYVREYSERMNLKVATPQNSLSSTGYALAQINTPDLDAYLVYQPGTSSFTVDLSNSEGTLNYEWFNPRTGAIQSTGTVSGGSASQNFDLPTSADWILFLYQDEEPEPTPEPTPTPTPEPTPTPAPVLTSILPNSEYNNQAVVPFELTGTDFLDGATVELTLEDNPTISATSIDVVNSTSITGVFDLDAVVVGTYDVVITNLDEQSDTLEAGFTVLEAEPEPTPSPTPEPTPSPTPTPIDPMPDLGPLTVSAANPRYFSDTTNQAILLTGSHTWNNLQDWGETYPPSAFDYTEYLNFLENHNHNFFRLWAWEQPRWMPHRTAEDYFSPTVYARTGPGTAADGQPKFDVTQWNEEYFTRLRDRVLAARERGIYVSVMLFQGWSIDKKGYGPSNNNPWDSHPYNAENNINGIDGDTNNDDEGDEIHTLDVPATLALQEAYIEKVVDTLNDLENVLYEVSNESHGDSESWQYHIITYLQDYQADKPNQHPIGMTVEYPGGSNTDLFNSPADWISPNGDLHNRPAASGSKVIIADTDHFCGICGDREFVWKSFTRGENPVFMDDYEMADWGTGGSEDWSNLRENLGYVQEYAARMNLNVATPQGSLSSTGHALAQINTPDLDAYLVYQPGTSSFTVDLSDSIGELHVEWFNPRNGNITEDGTVTAGSSSQNFDLPTSADWILFLYQDEEPTPTPTPSPSPTPEPTPTPTPIPAPEIANIVPNSEYNNQETVPFTITGTDFLDDATVSLILEDNPTITATSIEVASSTTITGVFDLDGAVVGVYDVVVTNTDEQSDTLEAGFTVLEAEPEPTPEPTPSPSPTPEPTPTPTPEPTPTPTPSPSPTPPPFAISQLQVTTQSTSAHITWETNQLASSQVHYGLLTTSEESSPEINTSPRVESHEVTISSLVPCAQYMFQAQSISAELETTSSSPQGFLTTGCLGNAAVVTQTAESVAIDEESTVTLPIAGSGSIQLDIPEGVSSENSLVFQIKQLNKNQVLSAAPLPNQNSRIIGNLITKLLALTDTNTEITDFNHPITITMSFTAGDISSIQPGSLWIYYWDGSGWIPLESCSTNLSAHTVTCTTTHFTEFALIGTVISTQQSKPSSGGSSSGGSSGHSCSSIPPGTPPDIFQIVRTATNATLYINPASGTTTHYLILYGTSAHNFEHATLFNQTQPTGAIAHTINNLDPHSKYFFQAQAFNNCAAGPVSATASETKTTITSRNTGSASSNNQENRLAELTNRGEYTATQESMQEQNGNSIYLQEQQGSPDPAATTQLEQNGAPTQQALPDAQPSSLWSTIKQMLQSLLKWFK